MGSVALFRPPPYPIYTLARHGSALFRLRGLSSGDSQLQVFFLTGIELVSKERVEELLTGGGSLQAALARELIPATEIEDDVRSQTDAFNDLPHPEPPPVELVINVGERIENSGGAPASMPNHGQINAMVKELPKIMIPLNGGINIALVTLKFNGYLNDHTTFIPLEFVGGVSAAAFACSMTGFLLDKIAPKIANFSTQSGIALTTVSWFSLSSWIFSVKTIFVPSFFSVLALGTWGIKCFKRGLGGAAAL